MNTAELADRLAADHDLTKVQARQLVDAMVAAITRPRPGATRWR